LEIVLTIYGKNCLEKGVITGSFVLVSFNL